MMKKNLKFIVFDLDQTLFDHINGEKNSLEKVYHDFFKLKQIDFDDFHHTYVKINAKLWNEFEQGLHDVSHVIHHRFKLLCDNYHMKSNYEDVTYSYINHYIEHCTPYEGVNTILDTFSTMNVNLAICSNGQKEIQEKKINRHGIKQYFSHCFYGDKIPHCKPHHSFFEKVISHLGVKADEILFLGDSLKNDINPAKKIGMKTLHVDNQYLIEGKLACNKIINVVKDLI